MSKFGKKGGRRETGGALQGLAVAMCLSLGFLFVASVQLLVFASPNKKFNESRG